MKNSTKKQYDVEKTAGIKYYTHRIFINRVKEEFSGYGVGLPANITLNKSTLVYDYFKRVIEYSDSYEADKENLVVILLNTRLKPLGYNIVSTGTVNESIAHPREIFRPAIIVAAKLIILCHNHPSGDPNPSESDRSLTRKINTAANLLDIPIKDHIIIGDSNILPTDDAPYFSFQQEGLI